jgi:outer membrane biosynthesis protein TonB
MNLSRYLPIVIALLGIFIVFAGWRLGMRWVAPEAVKNATLAESQDTVRREINNSEAPEVAEAEQADSQKETPEPQQAPNASSQTSAAPLTDVTEPKTDASAAKPAEEPTAAQPETAASPPKKPEAKTAPEPPPPAPKDVARVREPHVDPDSQSLTVRITTEADIPACTWFTMENPRRIVVDVRGAWKCPGPSIYRPGAETVKTVVIGEHPDRLRVVLHVGNAEDFPEFSVDKKPRAATVTVRPAARPES